MAQQQQQQQQATAGIQSSMPSGTSGVMTSTANTISNASPLGLGVQGIGGIPGLGGCILDR
jgi:CUG-BP- and ETR3-like factor